MNHRSSPTGQNPILSTALGLARRGYQVFPLRQRTKLPATNDGFKSATTNEATIRGWFATNPSYNLAVATGPQPNGINLVAIDVDPAHGGDETWAWLANGHAVPPGPMHITRSGGQHLFFDAPADLRNTAGRLATGIDTRGAGGYVVVPPSVVVDATTGEVGHYLTDREHALGIVAVPPLPDWLVGMLSDQEPVKSAAVSPVLDLGDSVADALRARWVWEDELPLDGWVWDRGEYWVRPGKNPRDGHSAVLHRGGPLVVFTTERPPGGAPTRDGVGRSFSPWDYLVAYRCDGDTKRAAALVRGATAVAAGDSNTAVAAESALYPPTEWYSHRPWLSACRQMAQASGIAPAPMVLAFLTRWATLIPPGFSIPAINGARSSFDLIGVVAGTSGSGKSSVMARAEEMLPIHRKDLRLGLGIGSGEGVIEAFYAMADVVSDDGKKRRERVKTVAGVHFAVDEGTVLAELSGRAGTTHVTRLCTAWSGHALSTANASVDTFRHIESGQYRLTAMLGIQADRAHELMTDSLASQGFVGRLLFSWAEEPPVRPRPGEPEPFALDVPAATIEGGRFVRRTLSYPRAVWDELIDRHDARRGTVVPVEEHHHDLMRCKVAGTFALMDGRLDVSMDDWALATVFCDCSAAVRRALYAQRRQRLSEQRHNSAVARAEDEIVVDSIKERRGIASMAENIRRQVGVTGVTPRAKLRRTVAKSSNRHRFEPALELAVANGWVQIDEDGVHIV